MSSTLACHFQAPPVHAAAHMYRHSEMESQQSYSNNSYLLDSRLPADDIDVDSYSAHSQGFYDEAGYNRLPSGFGPSQFEEAEAAFRYNQMRNENMSDPNTSPQLLCPRPTLPPSQFSPHFSWSDWPSEPPISAYQTCSEHTSSIPNHPQAADSSMQHSFQGQQAVMSTSKFYPFVETVPGQTSNSGRDGGYVQHPLLASSFEQDSTYSTSHPRYYAAHQPIPPEKRSSYSELAPNITFMNDQAQPPPVYSTHIQDFSKPKDKAEDTKPKKSPHALDLSGPPLTSIGRKFPLPTTVSMPPNVVPSIPVVEDAPAPRLTKSKSKSKTRTSSSSSRSVNEPRRPSLACTFCRERKIACGRPPNGSPDPTCNQCARRSFRCRYLDLKSTSLVRSRAGSKVPSSSPRHK